MTKPEILKEALTRLYVIRESKSSSHRTREEEWLESLIKLIINYDMDEDLDIPVDLELLQSQNVYSALLERIRDY